MAFLHLFIVNKSGGLIHHRALSKKAPSISTNDLLRIGSTFHSLHAIAAESSPARLPGNKNVSGADDGIEEIQAAGVLLRSYHTRTGIKFVITALPTTSVDLDYALREIYTLYTDYALKDPFYELDMPIKCELFMNGVDQLVKKMEKTALRGGR
mmetsp:Transcript_63162/g.181690  ORF Transcript_63162/g.181690 Transcript_63162/m.181690 type:complete len:154 (-) Transcript_63162:58-519(-)